MWLHVHTCTFCQRWRYQMSLACPSCSTISLLHVPSRAHARPLPHTFHHKAPILNKTFSQDESRYASGRAHTHDGRSVPITSHSADLIVISIDDLLGLQFAISTHLSSLAFFAIAHNRCMPPASRIKLDELSAYTIMLKWLTLGGPTCYLTRLDVRTFAHTPTQIP